MQPDVINGLNLYAYCNDNPVMFIDENGTMPKWLKKAFQIIGAVVATIGVIGMLIGVVVSLTKNFDFKRSIL